MYVQYEMCIEESESRCPRDDIDSVAAKMEAVRTLGPSLGAADAIDGAPLVSFIPNSASIPPPPSATYPHTHQWKAGPRFLRAWEASTSPKQGPRSPKASIPASRRPRRGSDRSHRRILLSCPKVSSARATAVYLRLRRLRRRCRAP